MDGNRERKREKEADKERKGEKEADRERKREKEAERESYLLGFLRNPSLYWRSILKVRRKKR